MEEATIPKLSIDRSELSVKPIGWVLSRVTEPVDEDWPGPLRAPDWVRVLMRGYF